MQNTRAWKKEAKARASKRESFGLSQGVIANRIGVSVATVCRWERGVVKPRLALERAWEAAIYLEAK
jgi:DNA-binding transcriptional regulator YiaG